MDVREGDLLWSPSPERIARANVTGFARHAGRDGAEADPGELWRWSVEQPEEFWEQLRSWARIDLAGAGPVLDDAAMPGATWYPGASLNYVDQVLAHDGDRPALVAVDEGGGEVVVTYAQLVDQVSRCAAGLRRLGVGRGDRVAAYVPNRPEAVVAFLATASLGAIWTACSPDFGSRSVLDRFGQVGPTVLLAVTCSTFAGQVHDRAEVVRELADGLRATLRAVVCLDDGDLAAPSTIRWDELLGEHAPLEVEPVPFDHPLWVVYTSGTTGLPKSIVHGHGGIVLEHHKLLRLHLDLDDGDRLFWFTTTGWVMWNIVVGALLIGASAVLYDGSPAHPDTDRLWEVAARSRATFCGLSAGYVHASQRSGRLPGATHDLSAVEGIGVTGSPLSPSANAWLYEAVGPDAFVASISGGTDVCTAFVGSLPTLPVRAGHLQHACLGVAATSYDEAGREVRGTVGELVVTAPMPSMPVGFWGDDGPERYRSSYFEAFPGVWRHGDWVRFDDDGSCVVLGRSDATLNRGGVRMGSSEFYAVLDTIDEISDCVIIDTTSAGDEAGRLVLLVVVDRELDEALTARIRASLRSSLSPRHVPDDIVPVAALPHTLNGKRLEVPIRRLFLGAPVAGTVDPSAIDDPAALAEVAALAARWRAQGSHT